MPLQEEQIYTLTELNLDIRSAITEQFPLQYWVSAEISEFHPNRNGHCYLELIDKDAKGRTTARQRAVIWAHTYNLLSPYFEQETGERLGAGIKVLVLTSVTYHELYGMSLTIHDINPSYTIGEAVRHRAQILAQLQEDGIINDNKELPLPLLPQRIAIISSATAAGYGDFMNQLEHNSYGYTFYTTLYTAIMQGNNTPQSVVSALNRINRYAEYYDCVVIIRGGGSTSELACFDDYELACNVAQFPLPIIVGIGHERDETVLDHIAAVKVKTPTAAAEWLIECSQLADNAARTVRKQVIDIVSHRLMSEGATLMQLTRNIPHNVMQRVMHEQNILRNTLHNMDTTINRRLEREKNAIALTQYIIPERLHYKLQQEQQHIENLTHTLKLLSPDAILARGYSYITHNNKVIKSVEELPTHTPIHIHLADGEAQAHITQRQKTTTMSKKTSDTQQLTYTQAMQQLKEIVTRLQEPDCEIDMLRDYTKQALELLKFCKARLTETDEELKRLLEELGKEE